MNTPSENTSGNSGKSNPTSEDNKKPGLSHTTRHVLILWATTIAMMVYFYYFLADDYNDAVHRTLEHIAPTKP